jgi:hypothetical protein
MALPFRIKDRSLQGNFDELEKRIGSAGKWTPVAFATDWRNLAGDAASYGVNVTKDARGLVYGRGLAERVNTAFGYGGPGTTAQICTIPFGFRPTRTQYLMSWFIDAANTRTPVRVIVTSTGALYVDGQLGPGSVTGAAGGYIAVEGLTWPTF